MFLVIRRLLASVPAVALILGWLDQPAWLCVPPALMTGFLVWRHRVIRNRIGVAPWASIGFARHAMVQDLAALIGVTLASLPLFVVGEIVREMLSSA